METLEPIPQAVSSAFTFSRSVHFDTAIVTPPSNSIIHLADRQWKTCASRGFSHKKLRSAANFVLNLAEWPKQATDY
jgi:hypothetical protein